MKKTDFYEIIVTFFIVSSFLIGFNAIERIKYNNLRYDVMEVLKIRPDKTDRIISISKLKQDLYTNILGEHRKFRIVVRWTDKYNRNCTTGLIRNKKTEKLDIAFIVETKDIKFLRIRERKK